MGSVFRFIFKKKLKGKEILATVIGAGAGIGLLSFLAYVAGCPILIASFGASAVLVYGAVDSALAKPRNVIGGHLAGALAGVTSFLIFGETWYGITIGVAGAILLMMVTDTVHPPGGATAIVAIVGHQNYLFVLFPVLTGVVILVVIALITNKISPHRKYPAPKKHPRHGC